jgi:signal transduction histidine kinase
VSVVTDAVTGARVRSGRAIDLTAPDALAARVDPLRIEQVVTNLVENALKFSPRDTRVDVALREAPDARFEIVVRDRGAGVPAGERPRLFERYFQGDHGLGGMGLGLFLSREIVERHGGTISAEFPASGGTQVVVTIARDLEGGEA